MNVAVIADSVNPFNGVRLTTLKCSLPRTNLAELYSHRMLSRNAKISALTPTLKLIQKVQDDTVTPSKWLFRSNSIDPNAKSFGQGEYQWYGAMHDIKSRAQTMYSQGYCPRTINKLFEPFECVDVIITGTEWDDLFNVRLGDPLNVEMFEFATMIKNVMKNSTPVSLNQGDYHLPFVGDGYVRYGNQDLINNINKSIVSCALLNEYDENYIPESDSLNNLTHDIKVRPVSEIYNYMYESNYHCVFEHQGMCIGNLSVTVDTLSQFNGITHVSVNDGSLMPWSGNFRGWIQRRHQL